MSFKNKTIDSNKVLQIDLSTGETIAVLDSPYKASVATNCSCRAIKMVCKGQKKEAGGYFWTYENIELQEKYNVTPERYNKN